ncbi:unnamed protein product [Lathyrus sativus]|nr:unnamed protein product [Lathyrus sativus]
MDLIDLPVVGSNYTWFKDNGRCRSRLGRMLFTVGVINTWNLVAKKVGARDMSDHRPLWIKANKLNWGAKPFKVFSFWFDHPKFLDFVKLEWNAIKVIGSVAHILNEKFKVTRGRLRLCNKEVFGWVELNIDEKVDALKMEAVSSVDKEKPILDRSITNMELWNKLKLQESLIK